MRPSEIEALARLAGGMDYYSLLRVESSAPLVEIKRAYYRARRTFHPDRYLRDRDEVQSAVDQIARRINEAWVVLRDANRRPAYDQGLTRGQLRYTLEAEESRQEEQRARSGRTANGRKFFELARAAETRGETAKAIGHVQTALTFERDNEVFLERLAALKAQRREETEREPGAHSIR